MCLSSTKNNKFREIPSICTEIFTLIFNMAFSTEKNICKSQDFEHFLGNQKS